MTDRTEGQSNADKAIRHLEESVLSGRISQAEANVIRNFFEARVSENWPTSSLQRRMQDSGG
jgi:hypothetical protein